jgi:tyrosine-protein kinase Etk/Wzc
MSEQKSNFLDADDLRPILKFLAKNWIIMILSVAIMSVIAYFSTYKIPNIFGAKAEILLRSSDTYDYQSKMLSGLGYYSLMQDITNQKRVIASYDLVEKVLTKLDYTTTLFLVGRFKVEETERFEYLDIICDWRTMDDKMFDHPFTLKVLDMQSYEISYVLNGKKVTQALPFGVLHKDIYFTLQINLKPKVDEVSLKVLQEQNFQFVVHHPDDLIKRFKNRITIENIEGTSILSVQFNSELQSKAKTFLDTLAAVYMDFTLKNEFVINTNTEKYIDKQLDELTSITDSLETAMEIFKDSRNILDLGREQSVAFEALTAAETQQRTLQLRKQAIESLEYYLTMQKDQLALPPMNYLDKEDETLQGMVSSLFQYKQRRKELLITMNEGDRRINRLDSSIAVVRQSIINYTTDNKKAIASRIGDLGKEIISLETQLGNIPKSERDLLSIQRKLTVNEQLFSFLLQKKANTVIARAAIIPQTSIIEAARPMGVVGPNKKNTLWLFAGIGLGIALIIGLVRLIFFERIENIKELKALTKLTVVGGVPNYADADLEPIIIVSNPRSNVSEAFRSIRTNLQYYLQVDGPKFILVTSLHPGEGKTFSATNLAAVLAKASKKVMLVDFDLHKPKVHKTFGLENVSGTSSFLIGKTDFRSSILNTQIENLDALTAGPVPPNASELILNARVDELFKGLSEMYDYIIVDTPPLMLISDALVLLRKVHLGIFIMNTEKATKAGLRHLEDVMSQNGITHTAVVLNNIKQARWKYYYGKYAYRYGYGYGYGYGYTNGYRDYQYGGNEYGEEKRTKNRRKTTEE